MGRASRHKRERRAAEPPPARPRTEPRRHSLAIAGVLLGVLIVGLLTWNRYGGGEVTPGVQRPPLPELDTSTMTPPVAAAIREAHAEALANPESADAIGRLGQIYHAHWHHDAAAACYAIAHQLAPEEFRWAYLLAGVDELRGVDGERLVERFRTAIGLLPRYPPAHVRYGDALLRLGRWSDAADAYAAAIELDPELVLAHRGRGQAALLAGDAAGAAGYLEQAARRKPDDRIVQAGLARAYALLEREDQAAEAARKARSLRSQALLPDPIFFEVERMALDPESLRGRVSRSLVAGNHEAAIEALGLLQDSGVGSQADAALAHKLRANQLAFGGDYDAALAEFERAARINPRDPEIEHNWGTVLMRLGQLEEAGRHFEKAIELDPRSADSLYNLGVVLEGLGRTDAAIRRFTSAAEIDSRHLAARRLAELGVDWRR